MTKSTSMFAVSHQDEVTLISISSKFNALDELYIEEICTRLVETVKTAEPPLVAIDMGAVNYFGSSFLEVLFKMWHQVRKREGEMVFCGLQEHCEEIIQVSQLDRVWKQFADSLDAVEYLQSRSLDM